MLIDLCDELHNVRSAAAESKQNLESISEDYLVEVCVPDINEIQRWIQDFSDKERSTQSGAARVYFG